MKENSNPSITRQLLRKIFFPAVYRLQIMLGVKPRGVCLITGCPRSGTSALLWWLAEQDKIETSYESRILISAHRFLTEVERFQALHENQSLLISMLRRLFFNYHSSLRYLWGKKIIEKEPLEPIAFPDEKYGEFIRHVQLVLPEIKLLFVVRDPIETVWSMRQRKWGFSLTNQNLGSYSIQKCIEIWIANVKLIQEFASDSNVYICKFDRLISNPEKESHRIFDFLSIPRTKIFVPRPTKTPAFSKAEKELILDETASYRALLTSF